MGYIHITTNKDKKLKSIAIITLTLLATATVHAGALAEMSAALAEQQKMKIFNAYEEMLIKHGGTKSKVTSKKKDIADQVDHMTRELDKVALQKNKSCLLISNDWLKEQEELMAQELKEGNSPLTKDDYETFNTAGRDYIKYKCLAQSDFLNNSGKNKDE